MTVYWYWGVIQVCLSNQLQWGTHPHCYQYLQLSHWQFCRYIDRIVFSVIYLQWMAQVVDILSHGRQGPVYSLLSIPWLQMTWRLVSSRQVISSSGIDVVLTKYSWLSTGWITVLTIFLNKFQRLWWYWIKGKVCWPNDQFMPSYGIFLVYLF